MNVRALRVDPDGTMRVQPMKVDTTREVHEAVGGHIEAVTAPGWHAYLNEERNRLDLPANPAASVLLQHLGRPIGMVLGTAMFLGSRGIEEADAPAELLEAARAIGDVREPCSHSWVAGMMHVHDEDLDAVHEARSARGEHIECEHCETVYSPEMSA